MADKVKVFTLTVTESPGNVKVQRSIEGFNNHELLGYLLAMMQEVQEAISASRVNQKKQENELSKD